MSSKKELHDILVERGLELAGPLVLHPEEGGRYIAFIKVSVDRNGKKSPGARALSHIARSALESGYRVHFIVIDTDGNNFDVSLKAILFEKFSDKIRNTFSSFVNRRTEVWIEPKAQLTQQDRYQIGAAISEFSQLIGFNVVSVHFTDSEDIPTPTAILRVLRTKSPCSVENLTTFLKERGFTVPNTVWLSHALDKLRKAGLLVRTRNGEFFLSFNGLSRLGTAKGRYSPDIVRALDLAKRRA
jgi:hypothetical protein